MAGTPIMKARALAVLGTGSDVGKSLITAGLCRLLFRAGVRVAPFKAQNMSNNADVTPDGLEIGRAQSEQAGAAGLAPRVEMNPVLLKPQGDRTSQVVVDGRASGLLHSADFVTRKRDLWPAVERALEGQQGADGAPVMAIPGGRAGQGSGRAMSHGGILSAVSAHPGMMETLEPWEPSGDQQRTQI